MGDEKLEDDMVKVPPTAGRVWISGQIQESEAVRPSEDWMLQLRPVPGPVGPLKSELTLSAGALDALQGKPIEIWSIINILKGLKRPTGTICRAIRLRFPIGTRGHRTGSESGRRSHASCRWLRGRAARLHESTHEFQGFSGRSGDDFGLDLVCGS